MKSITLTYPAYKTVKIDISRLSDKNKKWLEAWFTEEEDRTDEQWDLVEEEVRFNKIIEEATGDFVPENEEIDIEDCE